MYIHIIRDQSGKRVFNVVTPNEDAKVTVTGLAGTTVSTEAFDMDAFCALETEPFPGRSVHLLIGGKDIGLSVNNHNSTSKIQLQSPMAALGIEFRTMKD